MENLRGNIVVSATQNQNLYEFLSGIKADPYVSLLEFKDEIHHLKDQAPDWLQKICEGWKKADKMETPWLIINNLPIDRELPFLKFEDSVKAKYRLKRTTISESILELFAQLSDQDTIGYKFVNSGDVYQDIHPLKELSRTQSQKAITNLGFHKDLANHFVRPDYVNILCLRNSPLNEVYTTFVRNLDLLDEVKKAGVYDLLLEEGYYTPFDALTKAEDKSNSLGKANNHAIIMNESDIRFFEGRTKGLNSDYQHAVDEVVKALHKLKKGIHFLPGDFIASENNSCIHGKENIHIGDERALENRWLMKTVNVDSIQDIQNYFVEDRKFIVNG